MILKLKHYDHMIGTECWKFISEIASFKISASIRNFTVEDQSEIRSLSDNFYFCLKQDAMKEEEGYLLKDAKCIIAKTFDNKTYAIFFDSIGYVLDEGKTIEKLSVYINKGDY